MSAIGTLFITAAATVGAVAAVRHLKRRVERHIQRATTTDQEPVIELKADGSSGVWRLDGNERKE